MYLLQDGSAEPATPILLDPHPLSHDGVLLLLLLKLPGWAALLELVLLLWDSTT